MSNARWIQDVWSAFTDTPRCTSSSSQQHQRHRLFQRTLSNCFDYFPLTNERNRSIPGFVETEDASAGFLAVCRQERSDLLDHSLDGFSCSHLRTKFNFSIDWNILGKILTRRHKKIVFDHFHDNFGQFHKTLEKLPKLLISIRQQKNLHKNLLRIKTCQTAV